MILLGRAGVGKTSLARALSARTGAPAIILDEIWQPGWGEAEAPAFRETLRALHAGEAWISDGNFAAVSFDIRLPRADLVVWVERPLWICLWRAATRVLRRGEAHRPGDLLKVFDFILGFDRRNRPRIEALRLKFGPGIPVIRIGSDREAASFIAGLDANGQSAD